MLKERIFEEIDRQKERLCEMADTIFDHPECDGEEMMAADLLCGYLAENGFSVEKRLPGRVPQRGKRGSPPHRPPLRV